jgi:hypothetical protein
MEGLFAILIFAFLIVWFFCGKNGTGRPWDS